MALDDAEAAKVGQNIIELLRLKTTRDGRVDTAWGTKTPLGLFRTIERIMGEHKP